MTVGARAIKPLTPDLNPDPGSGLFTLTEREQQFVAVTDLINLARIQPLNTFSCQLKPGVLLTLVGKPATFIETLHKPAIHTILNEMVNAGKPTTSWDAFLKSCPFAATPIQDTWTGGYLTSPAGVKLFNDHLTNLIVAYCMNGSTRRGRINLARRWIESKLPTLKRLSEAGALGFFLSKIDPALWKDDHPTNTAT